MHGVDGPQENVNVPPARAADGHQGTVRFLCKSPRTPANQRSFVPYVSGVPDVSDLSLVRDASTCGLLTRRLHDRNFCFT